MAVSNKAASKVVTLDHEEAGPEIALRKLLASNGVRSYVILNKSGIPVKYHGIEQSEALQQAALLSELTLCTQNFLTHSASLVSARVQAAATTNAIAPSNLHSQNNHLSGHLHTAIVQHLHQHIHIMTPTDTELVTLRLKSKFHEIILSVDENFTLIVTHEPSSAISAVSTSTASTDDGRRSGDSKKVVLEKKNEEEKTSD